MEYFVSAFGFVFPENPELGLALARRQLAHRRREDLVLHYGANALRLQQVPRVMDRDEIEGAENPFQRADSASHLAAQMKSFSDRPPMACVEYVTLHWL